MNDINLRIGKNTGTNVERLALTDMSEGFVWYTIDASNNVTEVWSYFKVNGWVLLSSNLINIPKNKYGVVSTPLNAITATTTSSEIDLTGYNAFLLSVNIAGVGTWKVDVKGRFNSSGTVMDIYDNNDTQLTTGNLTTGRIKLFTVLPPLISITATEVADGATCTVRIIPLNV